MQRPLYFAIVDEVDNILIDEARTPLIISGPAEEATDRYYQFAQIAKQLRPGTRLRGRREAPLGAAHRRGDRPGRADARPARRSLALRRPLQRPGRTTWRTRSRRRRSTTCDKEYIIEPDGEVVIVDEFTGRMMPGRRWSEGLHQAVEAKEGVRVRRENVTLATITFQNYFRMYEKLAGMTGTAETEAEEFLRSTTWKWSPIPTNRPMVRDDYADQVYKDEEAKFRRGRARDRGDARRRPPGAGRHHLGRDERAAEPAAAAGGHPARGAQRQAARARGADRRRRPGSRAR